jgi:hypothetical protein
MNKVETFIEEWRPNVLARGQLDKDRWAYLIEAPFDTPGHIPDLLGLNVHLDGRRFEIRGSLPRVPESSVKKGEYLGLLVIARPVV